jgi:hypothetical protein
MSLSRSRQNAGAAAFAASFAIRSQQAGQSRSEVIMSRIVDRDAKADVAKSTRMSEPEIEPSSNSLVPGLDVPRADGVHGQ